MSKSKSSVAVACFLLGRAKDLSAPLYVLYDTGAWECTFFFFPFFKHVWYIQEYSWFIVKGLFELLLTCILHVSALS